MATSTGRGAVELFDFSVDGARDQVAPGLLGGDALADFRGGDVDGVGWGGEPEEFVAVVGGHGGLVFAAGGEDGELAQVFR